MSTQALKYRIHAQLLRSGWLLDTVYHLAFYAMEWKDRITERLALLNRVTPRELRSALSVVRQTLLRLDVTTACNARCAFCAYPKVVDNGTLKPGVMTSDLFKRTVMHFAENGGKELDLTPVVGEPLLDPQLFDKIAFATQVAGIRQIGMISNGILLDKNDNYKRVVESGLTSLSISTQGTERTAYQKVYGIDKYDAFISGLHHLLAYNRELGEPVSIRIRFRNSQKPSSIIASDDFEQYIKPYLSPRVQVSFTVRYGNWAGTIAPGDVPAEMKLSRERPQVNVPCQNLFSLSVIPSGHIRMCGCILQKTDVDELVVGHPNWGRPSGVRSLSRASNCPVCR